MRRVEINGKLYTIPEASDKVTKERVHQLWVFSNMMEQVNTLLQEEIAALRDVNLALVEGDPIAALQILQEMQDIKDNYNQGEDE